MSNSITIAIIIIAVLGPVVLLWLWLDHRGYTDLAESQHLMWNPAAMVSQPTKMSKTGEMEKRHSTGTEFQEDHIR
jgi:hypothetical protein